MAFTTTYITVRYGETDQMGVVYHSNYFRYFEVARSDFFKQIGFTYKQLEADGYLLPLISCASQFISPAKYDDTLQVTVSLKQISAAKLILHYDIYRQDDSKTKHLASGETVHAFVNKQMKPLNINKAYPTLYKRLSDFID